MRKLLLRAASAFATVAIPMAAFTVATPAHAELSVVFACDPGLPTPDATACAGYYSGNLINGSEEDIANQQEALATIGLTWDGDWDALDPEWKIEGDDALGGPNSDQINFGTTLYGVNYIGAHFGGGFPGITKDMNAKGGVSVFWRFDFGTEGANYVTLDNPKAFSNAVLYTPPGVPEPATWAMMLIGFGAVGSTFRRRKARMAVTYA